MKIFLKVDVSLISIAQILQLDANTIVDAEHDSQLFVTQAHIADIFSLNTPLISK